MSSRTPDVQLCARDATLCIIGHLAPNLGKCPDVFLLLQVKYFSDILRTSDSAQWPQCFCIIGQLMPNSAERSDVFPFCYDSNISLIYCGHPVRLWMSESAQWLWPSRRSITLRLDPMQALTLMVICFILSDNLCPTRPSVPMFSFHNISPFLLPDLFSSLPCLSNQ